VGETEDSRDAEFRWAVQWVVTMSGSGLRWLVGEGRDGLSRGVETGCHVVAR
jgi:hypothetical protein